MAAKRISDDERQAIIATLQDTENVRETARRHGRSKTSVSRIAVEEGIETAGRPQTQNACAALEVDNAARRAKLKSDLLDDADWIRQQLRRPCIEKKAMVVSDGVQNGSHVEHVEIEHDLPPFADQQRIMTAVGIAVDKVGVLERLEPERGAGRSMLEELFDGLAEHVHK